MSDGGRIARAVGWLVGWSANRFLDIERAGPVLTDGPVLITANHPNSLFDPLLILRTAGRTSRPVARAALFEQAFTGVFLRALGGLPVYRRQDRPDLMHLNEHTFDAAIEALHRGQAVQIFPEGTTHSDPAIAPLRTGAARIAFMAEDRAGWTLGLRIAPVGLTYGRKHLFRGRGLAAYGEPFPVSAYRDAYVADPAEAVRALTAEIGRRIRALTLNFAEPGDRDLIDIAERMYAREKGWVGWRQREGLAQRFPRLQAFALGLEWLRAYDPERYDRVRGQVALYRRKTRVLGSEQGDIPRAFRLRAVVQYVLLEGAPFLIGLPFAGLGAVLWWPAYKAPLWLVRIGKPHFEAIATYKLSAAFVVVPILMALWMSVAWLLGGWTVLVPVSIALPLLGLIAIAWRDRWLRMKEDTVLFWRALGSPTRREVLADMRGDLVAEFDELAELYEREGPQQDP